jgi:hypothetical protein
LSQPPQLVDNADEEELLLAFGARHSVGFHTRTLRAASASFTRPLRSISRSCWTTAIHSTA